MYEHGIGASANNLNCLQIAYFSIFKLNTYNYYDTDDRSCLVLDMFHQDCTEMEHMDFLRFK